jgi:hypothetical protein
VDALIQFTKEQIQQDRDSATDEEAEWNADLKQAVLDLNKPRYNGNTWVCDGCSGYDGLRRMAYHCYAPCGQLEALVRVYTLRPGFDPDWLTATDD